MKHLMKCRKQRLIFVHVRISAWRSALNANALLETRIHKWVCAHIFSTLSRWPSRPLHLNTNTLTHRQRSSSLPPLSFWPGSILYPTQIYAVWNSGRAVPGMFCTRNRQAGSRQDPACSSTCSVCINNRHAYIYINNRHAYIYINNSIYVLVCMILVNACMHTRMHT